MKVKIKTTIIFLIFAFQIFGQTSQEKEFEIGITYSPIFTISQKYERHPAFNFSYGIFTKYEIFKKMGISAGINYQRQNINTIQLVSCDPLGLEFLIKVDSKIS